MEKETMRAVGHLLVTVFLSGLSNLLVLPAITDVTMTAVCPGQVECSLAIYLTGFQQAIIGVGTMVMMPLIGNLSDQYGRKALLTIPMTLSIVPLAILAYRRTTNYFYAHYVLRTLTAMVCEGSTTCLTFAYVADKIKDEQRTSAFGILSGVASGSLVCGTLAARFLPTDSVFQVATLVSMVAAVYMRIFLEESMPDVSDLERPILKEEPDAVENDTDATRKTTVFKKIPSIGDLISLLGSSKSFSQAAVVAFFIGLGEGGLQSSVTYYLRARFQFSKNQFADLILVAGVVGMISQLVIMPILVSPVGEKKLLSVALLVMSTHAFLYSVAWAPWVPYAATALSILMAFGQPCLRSIASKQIGPREQGKAHGCLSGISSIANIISPLIFSPLTALFLSENAPFPFPGFSLFLGGLASMISFIQSLMIRDVPSTSRNKNNSNRLA